MMGGWAGAKPRARVGVGNLKKEGVLSILSRARPEQQAAVLRAVLGRLTPKKNTVAQCLLPNISGGGGRLK